MTGEDTLSFVHTTADVLLQTGTTTVPASQIAVNGVLLDRLLAALKLNDGAAPPDTLDMMRAPLQADLPLEYRVAFLNALRGDGWSADDLQPGRVPVAFCAICGNSSCGHMWSATLTMSPSTVVWKGVGWEIESFEPLVPPQRRFLRRTVKQEFVVWVPARFLPEVTFVFARDQYEGAVLREIEDQTQGSSNP